MPLELGLLHGPTHGNSVLELVSNFTHHALSLEKCGIAYFTGKVTGDHFLSKQQLALSASSHTQVNSEKSHTSFQQPT